jgi:DDB1- and CUL4-associated factor 10
MQPKMQPIFYLQWTCIHDIQDFPESEDEAEEEDEDGEKSASKKLKTDPAYECSRTSGLRNSPNRSSSSPAVPANLTLQAVTDGYLNPSPIAPSNETLIRNNPMPIVRIEAPPPGENEEAAQENMAMNLDIWAADVTIRNRNLRHTTARTFNSQQVYGIHSGISRRQAQNQNTQQQKVAQNANRMIYYITEPHKGKGFIKELCFSSDGRVICSPYEFGIRLLAFDEQCHELPMALANGGAGKNGPAKELYQIKVKECHSDIVVSTKFSPRFPLLVTGCLRGKIVWHQPLL